MPMQPTTPHTPHSPLTPEMRLEANRARIRRMTMRLQKNPRDERMGPLGELTALAHALEPAASAMVRRYPVRSLAGGAAVAALLVRLKPWRGLLGSVLGAALIRQASAASLQWMTDQASSIDDTSR